jgi:hypothetical protein
MATTDRTAGDGIVVTIPAALAKRLRDGVSAGDLHARAEDLTWAATYKPPATRKEWLADVRTRPGRRARAWRGVQSRRACRCRTRPCT